MNVVQTLAEIIRPDRDRRETGVLGMVDEMLAYCRDRELRLTWKNSQITTDPLVGGESEQAAVELRSSVFRAVLARLAALCNRHRSDSVSPYGGRGEFATDHPTLTVFRVNFRNTPDEQWLELAPVLPSTLNGNHDHRDD